MINIKDLDINYFMELAKNHVGEVHNLEFQTFSKRDQYAGKYEILDFIPAEEPKFDYSHWSYEEDQTPNEADLGYYMIKISDSKFYNGKTIKVHVTAYVQDDKGITKALYIWNVDENTGKRLKAYEFGIIDYRQYK